MLDRHTLAVLILALSPAIADIGLAREVARAELTSATLNLAPEDPSLGLALTISTPEHEVHRYAFEAGVAPSVDLTRFLGTDGYFRWELRPVPPPRRGERKGRRAPLDDRRLQSGGFRVIDGALAGPGGEVEEPVTPRAPRTKDVLFLDDVIIDGSACIGSDCINNESFGTDSLRIKEARVRVDFRDTSSAFGFPTNDWGLAINDTASGGAEYFSIEDRTADDTPFTIEAGAGDHALFVDDRGRVGIGTSTPSVALHVTSTDTPTLRLDQTGAGGFTPTAWDLGGNEAGFFVRNRETSSELPLRIRPGAPSSAIDIEGSGDVGIGTASPTASLHVQRTDGMALLRVDENATAVSQRRLLSLENNGEIIFAMINENLGREWRVVNDNLGFVINLFGDPGNDLEFLLDVNGNLTLPAGSNYLGSDRHKKADIRIVDGREVLDKIASLPIAAWSWKDESSVRHLGPMAQDFHALFGLGKDDVTLTPTDLAGVALAAIQGLEAELDARDERIRDLERRLERLESKDRD